MDRIERVQIKGVGPFVDLDIEFPPKRQGSFRADLHLLTGQNGAGKSTLLYVLASCFSNNTLVNPRLRSNEADWFVTVGGTILGPGNKLHPHERALSHHGQWNPNWRVPWAAFGYSGMRQVGSGHIKSIQEPDNSPFVGALSFSPGPSQDLALWVANAKSEADHHKANGDHDKAKEVTNGIRQIEEAVSRITDKEVKFELGFKPIEVRFRIGGDRLYFDVLPEGLKSILSWLGDIVMRLERMSWEGDVPLLERPFYLFLDEIDVHLHPAWQRKVLPVIQDLFPNAQIFAATHSPFVAASISEGYIHRLDLARDGTACLGERIEAHPGRSVDLVLEDVFSVPERFDIETEKKLEQLRKLRDQVLVKHEEAVWSEWKGLLADLSGLGEETRAIAAAEERQVQRIRGKKTDGSSNGQAQSA